MPGKNNLMIRLPEIPSLQPINYRPQMVESPTHDARAHAGEGKALNGLAGSIAQLGGTFVKVAEETQKHEAVRIMSQKRMELSEEYAQFQLNLQKDPDPQSRLDKTNTFLRDKEAGFDDPSLTSDQRDSLKLYYDGFASETRIASAKDAASLEAKRSYLALGNEMDQAKRNKDRPAFQRALQTGLDAGVVLPEKVAELTDDFDQDFQAQANAEVISSALENDPEDLAAKLEDEGFRGTYGIQPEDVPRLKNSIKGKLQEKRNSALDDVELAQEKGIILTDEHLAGMPALTELDKQKIRNSQAKNNPPTNEEHAATWDILFRQRADFDNPAISDEDYAESWNERRAVVLEKIPVKWQGDIRSEIQIRSPANRKSKREMPDGSVSNEDRLMVGKNAVARARDAGVFGDLKSEKREEAYRKTEDLTIAIKRYISQNPEATVEEVREYADKAISGDTSITAAKKIPIPGMNLMPKRSLNMPVEHDDGRPSDALLPPLNQKFDDFLK